MSEPLMHFSIKHIEEIVVVARASNRLVGSIWFSSTWGMGHRSGNALQDPKNIFRNVSLNNLALLRPVSILPSRSISGSWDFSYHCSAYGKLRGGNLRGISRAQSKGVSLCADGAVCVWSAPRAWFHLIKRGIILEKGFRAVVFFWIEFVEQWLCRPTSHPDAIGRQCWIFRVPSGLRLGGGGGYCFRPLTNPLAMKSPQFSQRKLCSVSARWTRFISSSCRSATWLPMIASYAHNLRISIGAGSERKKLANPICYRFYQKTKWCDQIWQIRALSERVLSKGWCYRQNPIAI